MALKIKVTPEDFVVEEIAALPLTKNGDFAVYRLTKRGLNTVELLDELSRTTGAAFPLFSYGGKKDRYGLTTQYISIKSPKRWAFREKKYSLQFAGTMQRPMGPDLIEGNKFQIAVRNLVTPELKQAVTELEAVTRFGYENYFDDQRFGSFDAGQGFFAEKVLKKQYSGALKIYLTSINPQDKKDEKERKRFLFEHWKEWHACLNRAKTAFEKKSFESLARKPNGFLEILKEISRENLSTFFSSYQSYLWNDMLRKYIASSAVGVKKRYPGKTGDYIFYAGIPEGEYERLQVLALPTPGTKPKFSDSISRGLYTQVLVQHGLKNSVFNSLKLRKAFFKSFLRNAIAIPQNLAWDIADDEFYRGKKKLTLGFTLSRGGFATMLIKRIFSLPLE